MTTDIVVVGGGPTGVELSGSLAELKKNILPRDYPDMDFSKLNIYLLEAGPATLGPMSKISQQKSQEYLESMGVQVKLNTQVKDYDGRSVLLADGTTIETHTLIWAAGVTGNVPQGIDASLLVRGNRIKVDAYNRMEGSDSIFVLGDIAYMEEEHFPNGHPQVAPVAIQQGTLLATNLLNLRQGKSAKAFRYKDKGAMATVGRNLAVVDVPKPKLHFGGFFAWLIWMGLHLMLILGVKNKFFVFTNWLYNYFTYDQSLRLIFKEFYRREGEEGDGK